MENETQPARITLMLQSDEAAAFSQLGFAKKRIWHHKLFWIQLLAFLFLGIIGYFFSGGFNYDVPDYKNIWRLLIAIVIAVVFIVVSFALEVLPAHHERFLKKEKKLKKEYSGLWELVVYRDGLFVTYGKRGELIGWEIIEQAEVNENCLYLKLNIGEHLILPREKVLTGDYDLFVSAVQERIMGVVKTNIKSLDEPFADH